MLIGDEKMKKKFRSIIFGLVAILMIPMSAFASDVEPMGAGEWDILLNKSYSLTPGSVKTTDVLTSGGGDVRYCVSGVNAGNEVEVKLYNLKSDRVVLVSAFITSQSGERCTGKIDARPFVEGSKAKFYLTMTTKKSDTVTIKFED